MAAQNPGGEERAKRKTIAYVREFELYVALKSPKKYDWFILGELTA